MSSRVLVVDDETQIRRTVGINLRAHGFDVDLVETGEEALALAGRRHPDVMIVDLGLPGIGGLDVIESIRDWSPVPIIVLSVRDTEADKVAAIDAGADDYVTKPFGMDELLARIRAALRRAPVGEDEPVIETPSFTVDLSNKRVTRGGEEIPLTPTEWQLIEVLVRNRGKLVSQRQLLEQVWGPPYDGETGSNLREHVARVRRKIEPEPSRPRYLVTETGLGYRFQDVD